MTFKEKKKPVIEALNKQRWSQDSIEWPMFGKREPLRISKHLEEHQRSKEKELTGWEKLWQGLSRRQQSPVVEPFYSWECLSIIRGMLNTSFDIVVRDMHHLLCLIHVVHRHLYDDFSASV